MSIYQNVVPPQGDGLLTPFYLSSIRKVPLVERFDVQFSSDSTRPVNDGIKIRENSGL